MGCGPAGGVKAVAAVALGWLALCGEPAVGQAPAVLPAHAQTASPGAAPVAASPSAPRAGRHAVGRASAASSASGASGASGAAGAARGAPRAEQAGAVRVTAGGEHAGRDRRLALAGVALLALAFSSLMLLFTMTRLERGGEE